MSKEAETKQISGGKSESLEVQNWTSAKKQDRFRLESPYSSAIKVTDFGRDEDSNLSIRYNNIRG